MPTPKPTQNDALYYLEKHIFDEYKYLTEKDTAQQNIAISNLLAFRDYISKLIQSNENQAGQAQKKPNYFINLIDAILSEIQAKQTSNFDENQSVRSEISDITEGSGNTDSEHKSSKETHPSREHSKRSRNSAYSSQQKSCARLSTPSEENYNRSYAKSLQQISMIMRELNQLLEIVRNTHQEALLKAEVNTGTTQAGMYSKRNSNEAKNTQKRKQKKRDQQNYMDKLAEPKHRYGYS